MTEPVKPKSVSLTDEEIVSAKKITRRSILASTGIGAALGAAGIAAGSTRAHAYDAKTVDTDRPPTRSDPDKD